MTDKTTSTRTHIQEIAEEVLRSAARKLNEEIRLSPVPVKVFTIENETKLEKEDYSGSNLSVITNFIDSDSLCGGFTTSQTTRTFKTKEGRGYIDSEITILLSEKAVLEGTINFQGVEKAIKVLAEGYLRSLHTLYRPDQLTI